MTWAGFKATAVAVALLGIPNASAQTINFNLPAEGVVFPKTGPKSWCAQADVVRNVVALLNLQGTLGLWPITAVEFKEVSTENTDSKALSFACRGVTHLSNGQAIAGLFEFQNVPNGRPIWWWTPDSSKPAESGNLAANDPPADQLAFLDAVIQARNSYQGAKTDFQQGATRPARAKAICSVQRVLRVKDWAGKVVMLTTNGDGWGVLGIQIGPDVRLDTAGSSLGDIGENSLISPNTAVFGALGQIQKEEYVRFSGEFLASDTDCVKETSFTFDGSLMKPQFRFRFSKVEKLDGQQKVGDRTR